MEQKNSAMREPRGEERISAVNVNYYLVDKSVYQLVIVLLKYFVFQDSPLRRSKSYAKRFFRRRFNEHRRNASDESSK